MCAYTGFGTQTKKYPNSIKNRYKKLQEMCLDVLGQKFNLSAWYKKGSTIDLIVVRIYDSDRFNRRFLIGDRIYDFDRRSFGCHKTHIVKVYPNNP